MEVRRLQHRSGRQSRAAAGTTQRPLLSDRLSGLERILALSPGWESVRFAVAEWLLFARGQFRRCALRQTQRATDHRSLDRQQHAAFTALLLFRDRSENQ